MVACHFNFQFQVLTLLKGTKELGLINFIVDIPLMTSSIEVQKTKQVALLGTIFVYEQKEL
jgi:hypothetical protein